LEDRDMPDLRDRYALIFNPVFIVGVGRIFKVLDPLIPFSSAAEGIRNLFSSNFLMPACCMVFSLSSSVLSHEANRKHAERLNQPIPAHSLLAITTYFSAAAILFMYLFGVELSTIPHWFGAYASLALINTGWNFLAVAPRLRRPHVWTNLALASAIILILVTEPETFVRPLWFTVSIVVIGAAKLWQRSRRRWA
jgi:hypothetical protein